jgi:hypothetical protein
VRWFGAKGDNATDDTTAIQATVNAAVALSQFNQRYSVYLPPGIYKISSTINLAGTAGTYTGRFNFLGSPGGTTIVGNINGYLVRRVIAGTTMGPHAIRDIIFQNSNLTSTGHGLSLGGFVQLEVKGCQFSCAGISLNFSEVGGAGPPQEDSFQKQVIGCTFPCPITINNAANTASIGIQAKAHTAIYGCDFSNLVHGVRLCGEQMSLVGARFENCRTALSLGLDNTGGDALLARGFFASISGEDNYTFIFAAHVISTEFSGCRATGGAGANVYTGQSANGIITQTASGVTYTNCSIGGSFSDCANLVRSYDCAFIGCSMQNGFASQLAWRYAYLQDAGTVPYQKQFIGKDNNSFTDWSGDLYFRDVIGIQRTVVGTTDTLQDTDSGRVVIYNSASAVSVTLPQTNTGSVARQRYFFNQSWTTRIINNGAGLVTITPTVSTIDGQSSIKLRQFEGTTIFCNGTDYFTTGHSGRAFRTEITPTALSGNVNDYNPTGLDSAFTVRLGGGAASRDITGIASGREGRVIRIVNIGATNNLVLKNQNASSASANRFLLTGDWTLVPNQVAALQYDVASAMWRPFQGGP